MNEINSALTEWQSKGRRMGCVSAAEWWCKRVPGWWTVRLDHYTRNGELFSHVVVTNGHVRIDLTPYADRPESDARSGDEG